MSDAFSPTGYWAYYTTQFRKADGTHAAPWVECWPIVDIVDDNPRLIFEDGRVLTLRALLVELREGSTVPDEDEKTYTVSLHVSTQAPAGEE